MARMYVARMDAVAVTGAITLVQVTAPSSGILRVSEVWLSQSNLTSGATQRVALNRKSGAATVTSFTPVPLAVGSPASSATAGYNASAEGSDSTLIITDAFNWLSGWRWTAIDERSMIIVPPSGIFCVRLPVAPAASTTITAGIEWEEIA